MGQVLTSHLENVRTTFTRVSTYLGSTNGMNPIPSSPSAPPATFASGNILYFGPHFILRNAPPTTTTTTTTPAAAASPSHASATPRNTVSPLASERRHLGHEVQSTHSNFLDPALVSYWEQSRRQTVVGPAEYHSEFTTLQCLVHIHRDSITLVKSDHAHETADNILSIRSYHLHFDFDSLAPCTIRVFWLAKEIPGSKTIKQLAENHVPSPDEFTFPAGLSQRFHLPSSHSISLDTLHHPYLSVTTEDASKPFSSSSSSPSTEPCGYPLIICIAGHPVVQSTPMLSEQRSYFILEGHELKLVKQSVWLAEQPYLLQEIFGLTESDPAHYQAECIVCMAELKDTIVLPCRHLCLCKECANQLRKQSQKCPICRQDFHSLLHLKSDMGSLKGKQGASSSNLPLSASSLSSPVRQLPFILKTSVALEPSS